MRTFLRLNFIYRSVLLATACLAVLFLSIILFVRNAKAAVAKGVSVTASVVLAENGDLNKDKIIEAGDTVTYSYTISNTSNSVYEFATLDTHIDHSHINFIHNIKGASSLSEKRDSIVIPNLFVGAIQTVNVSFDARVNIDTGDTSLTTAPQLLTKDRKSIAQDISHNVKTKKSGQKTLKSQTEVTKAVN